MKMLFVRKDVATVVCHRRLLFRKVVIDFVKCLERNLEIQLLFRFVSYLSLEVSALVLHDKQAKQGTPQSNYEIDQVRLEIYRLSSASPRVGRLVGRQGVCLVNLMGVQCAFV